MKKVQFYCAILYSLTLMRQIRFSARDPDPQSAGIEDTLPFSTCCPALHL